MHNVSNIIPLLPRKQKTASRFSCKLTSKIDRKNRLCYIEPTGREDKSLKNLQISSTLIFMALLSITFLVEPLSLKILQTVEQLILNWKTTLINLRSTSYFVEKACAMFMIYLQYGSYLIFIEFSRVYLCYRIFGIRSSLSLSYTVIYRSSARFINERQCASLNSKIKCTYRR